VIYTLMNICWNCASEVASLVKEILNNASSKTAKTSKTMLGRS